MLVQLSDPHIVAPGGLLMDRIDTPDLLARAVASVLALQPPAIAIVLTGDLVDQGSADEYAQVMQVLEPLTCPVWLMPDNHDSIDAMRHAFVDHTELTPQIDEALSPYVLWLREVTGLRLIALDTVVAGASHGSLCEHRRSWLDRLLAEAPQQPSVVARHHPPFASGIEHMDDTGLLQGADTLADILSRHPPVERVICGHLYRSTGRRFGRLVAMTVPSTAHQIAFDLREAGPAAWQKERPGFAVHGLVDGSVVLHVVTLGDSARQSRMADARDIVSVGEKKITVRAASRRSRTPLELQSRDESASQHMNQRVQECTVSTHQRWRIPASTSCFKWPRTGPRRRAAKGCTAACPAHCGSANVAVSEDPTPPTGSLTPVFARPGTNCRLTKTGA